MDQSSRKKNEDGGVTLRPVQIYKKMICIGTDKYVSLNGLIHKVQKVTVKRGRPSISPSYAINTLKKYGVKGVLIDWLQIETENLDKVWLDKEEMVIIISNGGRSKYYGIDLKRTWPFILLEICQEIPQ